MGGVEPNVTGTGSVEGLPLTSLLVPVVVFVGAGALAVWRRCYDAVRLQAVVAIGAVAGVVAVSRITGDTFDYLLRWWWPVAGLWWVSAAWSLWQAAMTAPTMAAVHAPATSRRTQLTRASQAVLVVIAVVVMVPQAVSSARLVADAPAVTQGLAQAVDQAAAAVGAALDQRGGLAAGNEVELHTSGGGSGWLGDAIGLQLERSGWNVVVVRNDVNVGKWGVRRTRPVDELEWRAGTDGNAGTGRRAVWVLGDPVANLPDGVSGPATTRVFDADTPVGPVQVFVAG